VLLNRDCEREAKHEAAQERQQREQLASLLSLLCGLSLRGSHASSLRRSSLLRRAAVRVSVLEQAAAKLLALRERLVGNLHLSEQLGGVWQLALVGMQLEGEAPVRSLDLLLRGAATHAQYLVGVARSDGEKEQQKDKATQAKAHAGASRPPGHPRYLLDIDRNRR